MNKNKLNAGVFSVWLSGIRDSIQNNIAIEVPCGNCHACCTSSLFIHIKHEETQTLRNISKNLLFDAPYLSESSYLLGYLFNGNCPLFKENRCSIYESRPNTCKKFDCRIFTAAGLKADDHFKSQISNQAERWEFSFPNEIDKIEFKALNRTVNFIKENKELFPVEIFPALNSELAILSIKVYKALINDLSNQNTIEIKKIIVNNILRELKHFDNVR